MDKRKYLLKLNVVLLCSMFFVGGVAYAQSNTRVYKNTDKNGHSQIYFNKNGKEKKVTDENFPHSDPQTNGTKIVWSAQVDSYWQIFYYDVYVEKAIQLTQQENNVNPKMYKNYIVWEGQRNGVWQIFLFDGVRTLQLTYGDYPAQSASVGNNFVIYAKKDITDKWNVYYYDILLNRNTNFTLDMSGIDPVIEEDKVVWKNVDTETGTVIYYSYDPTTGEITNEGTDAERSAHKNSLGEQNTKAMAQKIVISPNNEIEAVTVDEVRKEISMIDGPSNLEPEIVENEEEGTINEKETPDAIRESTESINPAVDVEETTSSNE